MAQVICTGLGQRLTKSDPTGSYWYMDDGAGSDAPVLSDAYTTFTPGTSEYNALGSRFYLPDVQGNSRGLLDASESATDGYNWDAFGNSVSRFGSNPTALSWGEGSGYQNDSSGLKMLGARYYDSRTGRFITADPIEDGDNWYAYCYNDPIDGVDPTGLRKITGPPNPDGTPPSGDQQPGDTWDDPLTGWTWTWQLDWAYDKNGNKVFSMMWVVTSMVTSVVTETSTQGSILNNNDFAAANGVGNLMLGIGSNAAMMISGVGEAEIGVEAGDEAQILYHYTSDEAKASILEDMALNASKVGGKDARYGAGQYLTDLAPGSMTKGQIARRLWGIPNAGNRLNAVIKINVTGLPVENPAPYIYRIPGENPLNLTGRIVP